MTAANRATRIGKLHSLLKKAYKPTHSTDSRPLMEHLLYACLLENSPHELADEALARLEQEYFDWNEVRVTTIIELSEVLNRLPDPTSAAIRLKKNLHGLFETTYSFDLEELKKQNLGKAVQKFEKLPAMTPFVLAYITQHGLGGHAIPLDSAALRFFWLADIINENELKTGRVTGLERAIPKSKGIEFSSLLHQASVALNVDPNDDVARKIVLTLNPELEQKVADHVALVKKRRVAKAKAAAIAASDAADAEAEAELKAASKAKSGKSNKSTTKVVPKPAAKSSKIETEKPPEKTGEKDVAKSAAKPIEKEKPAAKTGATKSAKSPKAKTPEGTPEKASGKTAVKPVGKVTESAGGKVADKHGPAKKTAAKKATGKKAASKKPTDANSSKTGSNAGATDSAPKSTTKTGTKRKPR